MGLKASGPGALPFLELKKDKHGRVPGVVSTGLAARLTGC